MSRGKMRVNKAKCRVCGSIIESTHRHDFVWCPCGAIAVDGGRSYLKRLAKNLEDVIEMSEYEEEETND